MSKKLIAASVCVLLCAISVFTVSFYFLIDYYNVKQAKDEIVAIGNIFVRQLNDNFDIAAVSGAYENLLRVSVIDERGEVVSDSANIVGYENHADRQEFKEALANGKSQILRRHSDTLQTDMLYYAQKITVEGETYVLRLSMPLTGVNGYLPTVLSVSTVILLALAAAVFTAFYRIQKAAFLPMKMIREGLENVANGKYVQTMPDFPREDMNEIYSQINDLSFTIHNLLSDYEREKKKTDLILDHMQEGLIALSGDQILMMNRKARDIFSAAEMPSNVYFLSNDESFIADLIGTTVMDFDVSLGGRIFEVRKSAAEVFDNKATIVLFTDVTERRNSEKMREEFFTNASHELKTPITAIKGFSEMLTVKEDVQQDELHKYALQIEKNTARLMRLISDMTQLSKLDAGFVHGEREEVDVLELMKELIADYRTQAEKRGIGLELQGKLRLNCHKESIAELASNLIDNAIKYNKENGKICIRLDEKKKCLRIEDTGIGMEDKHLPRIFERFYRVDKARSSKAGGTGLGLSIVKHIALIEGWKIDMKSTLNKGTTVSVFF